MSPWSICVFALLAFQYTQAVLIPPKITKQSPENIFYKEFETVKIECEASGIPDPSYYWLRAEVIFKPEGNDQRVVQQAGVGTLIINSPEDKDEGIYQCFATNSQGTAATIKFNLRMAKLGIFKSLEDIHHKPNLGDHLQMECMSPDSVPDADIYWTTKQGDEFIPIFWDARVTMDYDDRLHFTHVRREDNQDGNPYHCVAYNSIMRRSSIGPKNIIEPRGSNLVMAKMQKAWPQSRFNEMGLVGENFKMKCIFSGNPTPYVRWKKQGQDLLNDRVTLGNSGGQEIVIKNLQMEDRGTYLCDGSRDQEPKPLEMSINLTVNAAPKWQVKPKDVNLGEGETAEFECLGSGYPVPQIFWFVNGVPLEDALRSNTRLDERFKHLKDGKIVFEDVTKFDTMVFQCNVTNHHGYLWGEAFLNVLQEAPTILQGPSVIKVAEGNPFTMDCRITGKPDPVVTWRLNGRQVTGGRYFLKDSGSLYVESAVLSDAGSYQCHAKNMYGETESEGKLTVRRKTVIERAPKDLEVRKTVNAKFQCTGTTDPEEITNLKISWMKDYKPVELGKRMFLNMQDNSLTISGTEYRDSGTYTCVVDNGFDNATASASLVVTDKPDPCTKVRVINSCVANGKAEVEWIPGTFGNAPIQYFLVEYMTTIDPNHWNFAAKIVQTKSKAFIPLSPGLDYSFRVTSYNKIGASEPSAPSNDSCVTQAELPLRHPVNVRTIGDMPGMVHVEWTPVPPEYQGGKNFSYKIIMQRVGDSAHTNHSKTILDWRVSDYVYAATGQPYTPYYISVKSTNNVGDCREPLTTVLGHSDEGIPNIAPTDLELLEINPESVVLQWKFDRDEIGKINTAIQGEFKGFLIQFWEENYRSETIRDLTLPPDEFPTNTTSNIFNATVIHRLPNIHLEARVSVLNNFFVSAPSEIVSFTTPPGLPGPVADMRDINIGDNHINLQWFPPLDNRGDVIGFDIGYREVIDLRLEEMQEMNPQIDDPFTNTAMLSGLKPDTRYRIYIWARTLAGRGEDFYIERSTAKPGIPAIPRFTISGVGTNFINVSWWRDAYMDSGSIVNVEYKKEEKDEWFYTGPDVSKDWAVVRMLEPGITYSIRIAVLTNNVRRISETEEVTTDGSAKAYDMAENIGWLMALIFAILVQIAVFILLTICYRKGFRFSSKSEEVRTYQDGSETYTDKAAFPRYSEDFGPEPKGFSNDSYGGANGYDDYEDDGFDQRHQDSRNYEGEYDYDDHYDHDYPVQDYSGGEGKEREYREEKPRLSSSGRQEHEYEDYDMNSDRDSLPSKHGRSDTDESFPPPPSDLDSDYDGRGRYRGDRYTEDIRRTTREHALVHQPKRGADRRADYARDGRERRTERYDRKERDDYPRHNQAGGRRDDHQRSDGRYHRGEHHHHEHHRNDPHHDHEKCRDVVGELAKRYSSGELVHKADVDQSQGHSSTMV